MRWGEIGFMTCSVARALSVVGDRWTLLILRDAFLRTRRFEHFQASLGLTRHRLADRLRKLVDAGILERVRYRERPARYEYRLTEKGRDLHPVIVSLLGWGDRWMAADEGPPLEIVHRACGHQVTPHLACPDCGAAITARDVDVRPGPVLQHRISEVGDWRAALRAGGAAPPPARKPGRRPTRHRQSPGEKGAPR